MNKIILLLIVMTIGLSAKAFDWTSLLYQPYVTPQITQPIQGTQVVDYSTIPNYGQPYNQGYYRTQYQYPGQCVNPYQYQRPYAYGNNLPYVVNSALPVVNTTGGTQQIVKNIGQSMIYSMLRGY